MPLAGICEREGWMRGWRFRGEGKKGERKMETETVFGDVNLQICGKGQVMGCSAYSMGHEDLMPE